MTDEKTNIGSALILLMTAVLWGGAFVAQSAGMDYIGPFTFLTVRCFLATVSLLPVIFINDAIRRKRGIVRETPPLKDRQLITGSLVCGLIITGGCGLQQFGLMYTTAGKAAFITTLYIVIVPIAGILLKRKCPVLAWPAAGLGVVGLYFLSVTEQLTIGMGELIVLPCALFYTVHIFLIDHYSRRVDPLRMTCYQFFVSGVLSGVLMLIFEKPVVSSILDSWVSLVYSGVISGGLCYTTQMIGQRRVEPSAASLIMSMEAVAALVSGWLILGQGLTGRELLGCVLVFSAVLLVEGGPVVSKLASRRRPAAETCD